MSRGLLADQFFSSQLELFCVPAQRIGFREQSNHAAPLWRLDNGERVDWFRDDRNRDEAINILVTSGNLKPDEVAKSYDFFRKGEFFEPTGSVSEAKIRAVTHVLESLGDLPRNIDIDKLFLPGVTKVVD
jgi:hypothetical protein